MSAYKILRFEISSWSCRESAYPRVARVIIRECVFNGPTPRDVEVVLFVYVRSPGLPGEVYRAVGTASLQAHQAVGHVFV